MEKFKGNVPYSNINAEIGHLRDFKERGTPVIVFPARNEPFLALVKRQFRTKQDNNPGVVLFLGLTKDIITCGGGTTACDVSQIEKFPNLNEKLF